MSIGCYQPETLEELRALIASDPRTPEHLGDWLAALRTYAVCGCPGGCLVTRALEVARENMSITDIAVVPTRADPTKAILAYNGPDGEFYEEQLNALLNAVALRFDDEGQKEGQGFRSKQYCLDLLDKMIGERKEPVGPLGGAQ
jgi:hypothetical protein